MEVVFRRCCGLDVHKRTVVACLWLLDEAGKLPKEIRTLGTRTEELLTLYDWLKAHAVTHVARESTGVFWKPVYNILEEEFTVLLVNAAHIQAVPGRQTDVRDCEWIAELLAHGLLKGSFIPSAEVRDLRDLTRYRKSLIDERTREINRLHKRLPAANLKLSSVATDVMGLSGRKIMEALLRGTTDPEVLGERAKGKLRKKLPELKKALEGRFRSHHRFLLEHLLAHGGFLDEAIEKIGKEVAARLDPFEPLITLLDTIPGVNRKTAEMILAETGTDMGRFPTDRHLSAWAGLCPSNNESAGKRKKSKARKGDRWLKRCMIEAARAAATTKDTYLSALYHRLARRRGDKKAIGALAPAMIVIVYPMIQRGVPYRELGSDYFDKLNLIHIQRHHVKRLESLGFKVTLEPLELAA